MGPRVAAVARSSGHHFSKAVVDEIVLVAGLGVEGDGHSGLTVQHRSRVRRDPSQPNLRQVHLMPIELFDRLARRGYDVSPGDLGENVTTSGLDLHGLPTGTRLTLGTAQLEITGLRNPCHQIDDFRPGLLREVLHRGDDGTVVRLAGVMAVVRDGGVVRPGDPIGVSLPPTPHAALEPV